MVVEKYSNRIKETSINIVQTSVESIRKKDITKTGMRVYKDGFIGISGSLGNAEDSVLIKEAEEALANKIPYNLEPTANKEEAIDCRRELLDDEAFVNEIGIVMEELKKSQPNFYFTNKINLVEQEINLSNIRNLNLSYKDRYMLAELVFKEKSSKNIMDGFVEFQGRKYNRDAFLSLTNSTCDAYSNLLPFDKEGTYPVVFSMLEGLPLMKFLQDLNANLFSTGSSLLSGKTGEKLFSSDFTLYQSLNPEDGIHPFFDAEGTFNDNYRYSLIKNGVVVSPYTDKRTADKYKLALTGSAVAEYDSVPSLGLTGFSVEEANKSLEDLLGGEKAIFVAIASGGDFTPAGDFATPVQLPFLFDGKKLIGRLPELQVSSNIYHMFGAGYRGTAKSTINPLSINKYMVMDLNVSKI